MSECQKKEHVFDSITIEDRSWNKAADHWLACPEQSCLNHYTQDSEADPDSWFEEFIALSWRRGLILHREQPRMTMTR
jgi:hypothetical protein